MVERRTGTCVVSITIALNHLCWFPSPLTTSNGDDNWRNSFYLNIEADTRVVDVYRNSVSAGISKCGHVSFIDYILFAVQQQCRINDGTRDQTH